MTFGTAKPEAVIYMEALFPYSVFRYISARESRNEIYEWCVENFGDNRLTTPLTAPLADTEARWQHQSTRFWFKSATDATAFKLRWC